MSLWKNANAGNDDDWIRIKAPTNSNLVFASPINTIEVSEGNSKIIWVGYQNGNIERTIDDGGNWSGSIGTFGGGAVTDIAINPSNSDQVIVSYNVYSDSNLYLSTNANSPTPTWTNISSSIGVPVSSVVWHPSVPNWIYIGTELGILASEDLGANWSITPLESQNEGPVNTIISQLFFRHGSAELVAVTYGRGIWKSEPIRDKFYVDINNNTGVEFGTFDNPYNTFIEAYNAAGNGSEIVFLSDGNYDDINADLLMKKRLFITGINLGTGALIE